MSDAHQFIPPDPSELSKLLPGYVVDSLIARGGMGAVYHAVQTSLDREVAIKVLPPELGDAHFRQQFVAEAKSMARLNHPNLIGIYDYGEANGMPFIIMEFVKGESLYHYAYHKKVGQTQALRLVLEICEGLGHAHQAGILHRDIKPANILLTADLKPKIGDFGLARPTSQSGKDEVVYGTPGYAAPELLHSPEKAGPRADIFALGVLLYELLTGKLPGVPFQQPSSFGVSSKFDSIVRRAIHPSPGLRYTTSAQLAQDLKKLRDSTVSLEVKSQTRPRPKVTTGSPASSSPDHEAPNTTANPTHTSSANLPVLRNVAIIAILGTILWVMWGAYQHKAAKIAQEQAEIDRKHEEELAKRRGGKPAVAATPKTNTTNVPKVSPTVPTEPVPVVPPPPPKVETPMETLARLRSRLASGDRSEFPKGAIPAGQSQLFFVPEAMTWSGAARFAEEHGGHLICIPQPESLAKVGRLMPNATELAWTGGGAAGGPKWAWVDGQPWNHREPSTSLGTCAALAPSGVIKARRNATELPFFIEWKMDGTNPGSLTSQFKRLGNSLDHSSPEWPPGTITSEARRYFLVRAPISWDEADLNASTASATLAVASDRNESFIINSILEENLRPGETCWLGARKSSENWSWVTNEPWTFAKWKEDYPTENSQATSLAYEAGRSSGWVNRNPQEATNAYLLEWSPDGDQ